MLIYVDGDNAPGTRTAGIELLDENHDCVKVFYANNNQFYRNKKNRDNLESCAACRVEFNAVAQAADAVDFAIAIDCSKEVTERGCGVICLVSQDKHFEVIRQQIAKHHPDVTVVCAHSIKDGFAKLNVLEITTSAQLESNLIKLYGNVGKNAFKQIKQAIEAEYVPQDTIRKRFVKLLRKVS